MPTLLKIWLLILVFMMLSTNTVTASNDIFSSEPMGDSAYGEQAIRRLERLEPKAPIEIMDAPFIQLPLPSHLKSPQEIMKTGQPLKYTLHLDKPDWKRPVYKSYWHSSVSGGRWSYVPIRLYYAQHRLFTDMTAAASELYDFVHNLGLSEELMHISTEKKGATQKERLAQVMVVAMQAKVEKVLTSGNQVVIVARPQRTGVKVFTVSKLDMHLDFPDEAVLFQLVTPDGDKIDYSVYR
jgi:hypothetical protein